MSRYQVFTGAPTPGDLRQNPSGHAGNSNYRWQTVSEAQRAPGSLISPKADVYKLPHTTLEAAGRRISMLYENIIFEDDSDPEEHRDMHMASDEVENNLRDTEQTTVITWPPTLAQPGVSGSRQEITFLHPSGTFSRSHIHPPGETQATQETNSYSYSVNDSSDASVARFPQFHFPLSSLTSLGSLQNPAHTAKIASVYGHPLPYSKRKVNLLVSVLEIEGPDAIHIKKGPDAGKEVAILKIIVGDEEGQVCRMTAWREVAEQWGGSLPNFNALKRGDAVYFENIMASSEAIVTTGQSTLSLTASPSLRSSMLICYRAMPRAPDVGAGINDERFRPDLRLGHSDAAVRKVATIVRWFEGMAGLPYS